MDDRRRTALRSANASRKVGAILGTANDIESSKSSQFAFLAWKQASSGRDITDFAMNRQPAPTLTEMFAAIEDAAIAFVEQWSDYPRSSVTDIAEAQYKISLAVDSVMTPPTEYTC